MGAGKKVLSLLIAQSRHSDIRDYYAYATSIAEPLRLLCCYNYSFGFYYMCLSIPRWFQSTCCKIIHWDVTTGADTWRDEAVNRYIFQSNLQIKSFKCSSLPLLTGFSCFEFSSSSSSIADITISSGNLQVATRRGFSVFCFRVVFRVIVVAYFTAHLHQFYSTVDSFQVQYGSLLIELGLSNDPPNRWGGGLQLVFSWYSTPCTTRRGKSCS